ncbi:hypothetical protein FRC11_010810 [Ceratobasidium sp. 423]|nr:hypothetical protein FRC11_010810 [Ceratobasidium sp. 423]
MAETSELWLQREKSPAIDLQDARQVIQAFSSRFQPFGPDRRLSKRATAATTAALLRFVTPFFCPGAEDLLPALLKAAIESIWDNTTRAQDVDAFTLTLVSVFVNFGHLLANFPMGDVTKVEAVDVITESGLIDLTARLMALPGELIRKKFKDEYFNWLNFRLHLLWRVEIAATDTPDSGRERELRRLCSDLWDEIGLFIGQYHETSADRLVAVNCGVAIAQCRIVVPGARHWTGRMHMQVGVCKHTRKYVCVDVQTYDV